MFNKMVIPTGSDGLRTQVGTFEITAQGTITVPLKFQPSKLFIYKNNILTSSASGSPNGMLCIYYDSSLDGNKQFENYCLTGGWYSNTGTYPLSTSSTFIGLTEITSTNFTLRWGSGYSGFNGTYYFIAIE